MKLKCLMTIAAMLVAFTAVNLFLPYAILLLLLTAAIGLPCKLLKVERSRECRLGTC